jgi:hypothetical protein
MITAMEAAHLIAARRQAIEAELAQLATRADELRKELADIAVAERVVARLSGASADEASAAERRVEEEAVGSKPPGTPSIPDMIMTVLQEDVIGGGMEPKAITRDVQTRWWPNVPSNAISSIAWRMWKRGQLRKEGSVYMLPEENEAADDNSWRDASAASDKQPRFPDRDPG